MTDPTDRRIAERTRFNDFDDAAHPCNKWWDEHGQYMMSGGGRRSYIWACRGWIAREQLMEGVEVTGDSLHETPPAAAPTPVQPAGARQWMDERFKGHMDGDYRTFDFDDETVVQLLDEYRAASVPVRPHMVAVPLKLIEDLKEFLNRRMERDRWLNEQSKLRDGLDDCLDPLRERPMDFCAMCAGTGKRFDKNDIYIGPCKCVRPACEHADSYVSNRTAPAAKEEK